MGSCWGELDTDEDEKHKLAENHWQVVLRAPKTRHLTVTMFVVGSNVQRSTFKARFTSTLKLQQGLQPITV
jgi:hypothetical protein